MPQVNRSQLIFIIIFLTLILPGPGDKNDGLASPIMKRRLNKLKSDIETSIAEVRNGSWDLGYGNLTGFKLSYRDNLDHHNVTEWPLHHFSKENPWVEDEKYSILPNEISEKLKNIIKADSEQDVGNQNSYFQNVTGSIRGYFQNSNTSFTKIPLEIPRYITETPKRRDPETDLVNRGLQESSNGFGDDNDSDNDNNAGDLRDLKLIGNLSEVPYGFVSLDITTDEKIQQEWIGDLVAVNVKLNLNDLDETDRNMLSLSGVYFQDTGNLVAVTRTVKFAGLYLLPHLVTKEELFNRTKSLMIEKTSKIVVEDVDLFLFDRLTNDADTQCEMVVYASFKRTELTREQLQEIDLELASPLGRPILPIPKLEIEQGLIYSPDCGILIELQDLAGVRRELRIKELRLVILAGIVLLFVQIFLSIGQMNATNTPSTTSRILFWSILLMNLADGSLSMLYLLCSAVIEELYLPLLVSSLLAFTLASVFEMRYMILIYSSQINERNINARVALQGAPIDDRVDANNGTILPTTQRPATEPAAQLLPQQQQLFILDDEQTISGQIYTRFFFILVTFTFMILNSSMWPRKSRLVFEYICLVSLSSFWVPQIYRNVIRGSRKSFKWRFIFGTTVLRLLPVGYVCLYKENPFHHHYDPKLFTIVVSWLSIQLLCMMMQEFFGPRFLLPDRYLPKSYDYHPILTELDLENGFGIEHEDEGSGGELQSLVNHHEDGKCKVDCAICMSEVELPIQQTSSVNPVNLLLRRAYMVTPCRHIFHTECLEGWMKYKLQCPTCRNPLPPL